MNPFQVVKTSWKEGDTREVECHRIEKQINVEYDSYRRVYIADGCEWTIAGQVAKEGGKKFYIMECLGPTS